ncbi:hypothetical protein NL676_039026 [Syzygium grande]|nr:hypothetical protein NL676_039026 [Syzygium grande]
MQISLIAGQAGRDNDSKLRPVELQRRQAGRSGRGPREVSAAGRVAVVETRRPVAEWYGNLCGNDNDNRLFLVRPRGEAGVGEGGDP